MKLVIKRTSFWLTGYDRWASPSLEKSLSIYDMVERRYTQKLFDYDQNNRILKIPRGVGQQHVLQKLEADGILLGEESIEDRYGRFTKPRKIHYKIRHGFEIRDDFQEKSINFLYQEKDAQKMLALDVGFGKTFCTIIAIAKLGVASMIICRTLGEQWRDFFCDPMKGYTDLEPDDVYMISGTPSIEKLLKKEATHKIYIASTDTLRSYHFAGNSLEDLFDHLGIGVKGYDEAHLNYVANLVIDVNTNVENTFYLTATPGRSDSRQDSMFKKLFRFIPISGVETHELKQYYNIRLVQYNSFPTAEQVRKCSTQRGFNSRIYAEYMFGSQPRKVFYYAMIRRFVKKLLEQDNESRVLIILDRLQDISDIYDILIKDLKVSVGRYCTLIPDKKLREEELKSRIVLSTIGSGVTGKDIPHLRIVLAMTTFSSQIITRQLLGRLRYLEGLMVYYFDFVDEGFPAMMGQRKRRELELKIRANTYERIYLEFEDVCKELGLEFDISSIRTRPPRLEEKKRRVKKTKKEFNFGQRRPGRHLPARRTYADAW